MRQAAQRQGQGGLPHEGAERRGRPIREEDPEAQRIGF